jgi:hypothetical protein
LCVIAVATSCAAIFIATRKAPPESNDALAARVSSLTIQVEECYDALDRWSKRTSVRDSRARARAADDDPKPQPLAATVTGGRTGILRQGAGQNAIHATGI